MKKLIVKVSEYNKKDFLKRALKEDEEVKEAIYYEDMVILHIGKKEKKVETKKIEKKEGKGSRHSRRRKRKK